MPTPGPDDTESPRRIEIEALEPLSLGDALAIVGEEQRATIIVRLGEARSTDPSESNGLTYSELMTRCGLRDSGLFNYHLDKLVGPFVKKRGDRYSLRLPGRLIYEAIVAGTLTERQAIAPFPVGECPDCDGDLSAAYHPDHLLTVECTACETLFDSIHLPAKALDGRSERELLDAAYQRRHHKVGAMRRGVCHSCGSVVERSLESTAALGYGDGPVEEMAGLDTYAVIECTGCGSSLVGHPANVALATPPVVGFFDEHDLDAALCRWWEEPVRGARHGTERCAEDPVAVEVPFAIAEAGLRVVLDDDLQVASTERFRG